MGYTIDFEGTFKLNKPLVPEHARYLCDFAFKRHMRRDPAKAGKMPDPAREKVGLPLGEEGCFFVGGEGFFGQGRDDSILDYNSPPNGVPGLWCHWAPNEEGTEIEWTKSEKFYNYVEWLRYLVLHFIQPWGYVLNGEVEWQGEDASDFGKIVVVNNHVTTRKGRRVYEEKV